MFAIDSVAVNLSSRQFELPDIAERVQQVLAETGLPAQCLELEITEGALMHHGQETLAMRVEGGGRTLGYSADSGPGWSLAELGTGLHLALCEATYLRDSEGKAHHMSARQAGLSGRAAAVERLVLTHRWPTVPAEAAWNEGSEAFGAEVTIAELHREYEV